VSEQENTCAITFVDREYSFQQCDEERETRSQWFQHKIFFASKPPPPRPRLLFNNKIESTVQRILEDQNSLLDSKIHSTVQQIVDRVVARNAEMVSTAGGL
jgi:hypothetical protein